MQPLANNFSKIISASFKAKLKFDTNTKLVMINKYMHKEKMFNKSYPYRSSKSKLVETYLKNHKRLRKNLTLRIY